MSAERLPELATLVALSELLYIAEGTALSDPATAKFCIVRIQKLTRGETIPFLMKPNAFKEKLEKVMLMLKHSPAEAATR